MSWLFSRALVEEFLEGSCSDGAQCAPSKSSPTPQAYLPRGKMTAFSRLSRSGMTFAPLTDALGAELLTWFLAAFPARTSQLLDQEPELTEKCQGCGERWSGSLAKYSPDQSSWKTAQRSLLGGWDEFSETWPKWGLMRSGECWEQTIWAPRIDANASGLWPTPTVSGNYNAAGSSAKAGDGLVTAVAKKTIWPTATATATAHKGWSPNHNRADSNDRLDYSVERESFRPGQTTPPKRLNPDWVEWLMGWPIGWTELRPLEMGRFREWQQQHSSIYHKSDGPRYE